MKSNCGKVKLVTIYVLIFAVFLVLPLWGNRAVSTMAPGMASRSCIIIDAGHGGEDGGTVSSTGVYESHINLQIAKKLEDLLHFLGYKTIMIRDSDRSIYTEGTTIAAKKVSDIKERVRIVNTTPKALFLSIHQNHFHDSRYSGAQVFYNQNPGSKELAEKLQNALCKNLDPQNRRQCKKSTGVYLMEHINCTGILLECGFLSNPEEEKKLQDSIYQNNLCCVIAASVSQYLNT